MPGLTQHTGKTALYIEDNVDTDRIIPARFLSMVTRSGYGELLFHDVRDSSFPLDQPEAKGASILVVGGNFGCGSSREHAVWAIQQAGFRVVIARKGPEGPGYSDIFRSNAANCGLCLIELDRSDHERLCSAGSGQTVTVDLEKSLITMGDESFGFQMTPVSRDQIMKGLDLIGTTLVSEDQISEFESKWDSFSPSGVAS